MSPKYLHIPFIIIAFTLSFTPGCSSKGDRKEAQAAHHQTAKSTPSVGAQQPALQTAQAARPVLVSHTSVPGAKTASLADVAELRVASVVNISTEKVINSGQRPYGQDPFFNPFFRRQAPPHPRRARALGSGVIVSRDGLVITNNHVVDQASSIKVSTQGGKEFKASIVGRDPKTDVAVLRLDASPKELAELSPIPFGDSSRLRLADTVLAIGNPFGLGHTVTMGIVSAKGRANVGIVDYEDFIQTDAAINPGNSGGALINTNGELVGINTAILSKSGGYQGIGFAIPSNMVRNIMDGLVSNGVVIRGWLGVIIQNLSGDLSKMLALPVSRGVVVADVQKGSPAEKGGFLRGDVVVAMNGKPIADSTTLRNRVAAMGEGKSSTFDVYRQKQRLTLTVTLGRQPGTMAPGKLPGNALSGLSLSELNHQLRRKYQIDPAVDEGIVITVVSPGSPAARSGLREGDVVMEINRHAVTSLKAFEAAYSTSAKRILLLINRQGQTFYQILSK